MGSHCAMLTLPDFPEIFAIQRIDHEQKNH